MDLFREFQQSAPDDLESRMSTYEDAWLAAILMSIRSMRDAARWLLGVVVAWLFLVPQLTALRELVPSDLPLEATALATFALVVSVGLIVWSVLDVQAIGMRSFEIRNLDEDDLAYVQEWDLLAHPPTPELWREKFAEHVDTLRQYRYLTPEDAQDYVADQQWWITERIPRYPPPPHSGAAILAQDEILRMRQEERNASAVLSIRSMNETFVRAKWIILVGSFVAAGAILALVGPPAPQ
jgi:hypothetical protein